MNESNSSLSQAQCYLSETGLEGWLLYDYQGSNPILWRLLGENITNVTRPLWLYVPAEGAVALLVHEVDVGRFPYGLAEVHSFAGRDSLIDGLRDRIGASTRLAMEYSSLGTLPRVGRVDAGTIELVRSLGIDVVSSGDAIQYATERWMPHQLESHRYAARKLHQIVHDTVAFVRENVRWKLTEHDVAEHIRGHYAMLGLETGSAGEGARLAGELLRAGWIVLPGGLEGDILGITPPLVLSDEQLSGALDAIETALSS